jgi:hypothetical protein
MLHVAPRNLVITYHPNSLYLNNETFSIDAVLEDGFGNVVVGLVLQMEEYNATITCEPPCSMSAPQAVAPVDLVGRVSFSDLVLYGFNNDDCVVTILTRGPSPGRFPVTKANITLSGYVNYLVSYLFRVLMVFHQ